MNRVFVGLLWLLLSPFLRAEPVTREMLTAMDALCTAGPAAEAAIDWENLQLYRAGLKSDLTAMYAELSPTRRAAFRKAFVTGFARSFQARAPGTGFSRAAGKFTIVNRGPHPSLQAIGPSPLRIEFVRRQGRLKISQLWL